MRVNDLARELEVKSATVLTHLSHLGITTVTKHSDSMSDEVADKVRLHFRTLDQEPPPTRSRQIGEVASQVALPTGRGAKLEPGGPLSSIFRQTSQRGCG